MNIPKRMFTSEVLEIARWGPSKLHEKRRAGEFPEPIDRGKELIYDGPSVYRALGLIDENPRSARDPWLEALNGETHSQPS